MADLAIIKMLLIISACLAGVVVSLVTGILTKLGGGFLSASFIAGGAAFGGTVVLLVAILGYLLP